MDIEGGVETSTKILAVLVVICVIIIIILIITKPITYAYKYVPNVDSRGGDLNQMSGYDLNNYKRICNEMSKCKAFLYTGDKNGTVWIKSSVVPPNQYIKNPAAGSGIYIKGNKSFF